MAYKQTSPIPAAEGGTGDATLTAHGVVLGQGVSNLTAVAPFASAGIALVSAGVAADPQYSTVVVPGGGTGITSATAYAPICAGATSTSAFQVATTGFSTAGYVFTSNGNAALPSFQAPANDLLLTLVPINNTNSPYTVTATDQFIDVDCSAAVVVVKLPDAPATGRFYFIKDSTGNCATHNITITTVTGAVNIDGATSFVMNATYESTSVIFNGTSYLVY